MADFLDQAFPADAQVEEPAPTPETPIEQPVEAPAPEPTQEPAPEPTPAVEPHREERTVPLATFVDQRAELRELKRWKEEQEAKLRAPAETPNPYDDPNGFAAWQTQQVQQLIVQDRFERSHENAIERHGEDKVREAIEWATSRAQTNPSFAAEYMQNTRPVEWIVQQHQRDALLSDIGDPSKLDDWFAREAAKRGYAPQSAPLAAPVALAPIAAAQPAQKPAQPPRSLASETGMTQPAAHDDARAEFLSIFEKR